ncbi:hypothetical protein ACGFNU_09705 [Spirillospora sp. NPDC048911]|uniref:hypothetical protein n=1 Tax=Spirillospora sp. NPDC048911 TaxID=3364527 RepID=UPI00371F66B1
MGLPPPVAKSYPHSSQNRSLDGVPQSGHGVPGEEPTVCICMVGMGAAAPMRSPQTSQ